MKYRSLNADENQKWYLIFSLFDPFTGWPAIVDYRKFKKKFNGPGWYDLHHGSIPEYLKSKFGLSFWKIKVVEHIPVGAKSGRYILEYSRNENEGTLEVTYDAEDGFRTTEVKESDANKSW